LNREEKERKRGKVNEAKLPPPFILKTRKYSNVRVASFWVDMRTKRKGVKI
jgi:hypothetical protein